MPTSVHAIFMPDVSGAVSQVYDYSAPFGESFYYQAADGSTSVTSASVSIPITADWISAPGFPAAVRSTWTRSARRR